jgi:hypothetical protein
MKPTTAAARDLTGRHGTFVHSRYGDAALQTRLDANADPAPESTRACSSPGQSGSVWWLAAAGMTALKRLDGRSTGVERSLVSGDGRARSAALRCWGGW